ncbi:peptidylprolyl isomerase [Chitinophaga lutea]|uniref:Peptidyl-prolyl cis-trans isomerase n=1 Tax=Chitinophaga lutea TaxID=2488634 RepID=A0A3N4PLN1_9BACT|nr:FKBP-type peptidyl-prolyl cis-trans isomerase [Chitinophaga lutea]RPE09116.1 peptidylprolyl isomerase [Chitinophaga lutea]
MRMRHYFGLLSLLAVTFFAACNKNDKPAQPFDPAKQAETDEQLIREYIAKNNITGTVKDATSALHYKVLAPGIGGDTMKLNDRMNVSYKGTLLNGTVFDEGDKTRLSEARLDQLIEGWKIGLRKITKEGKIQLFVPSALGYKNSATGKIPANSVLIFEVTLHNYYY